MRKLLNTLFVTTENAYLSLDGENVVIQQEREELGRYPLHMLENVVAFTYAGASLALMGACANRNVNLCFCKPNGRFLATTVGTSNGNVLLRRTQYRIADHALRVEQEKLCNAAMFLQNTLTNIQNTEDLAQLRGLEGETAAVYFSSFNEMILNSKKEFYFHGRSRRPPLDRVNALLLFTYSLLANDCAAALEAVGLDSYVGFLHSDRPGRVSFSIGSNGRITGMLCGSVYINPH